MTNSLQSPEYVDIPMMQHDLLNAKASRNMSVITSDSHDMHERLMAAGTAAKISPKKIKESVADDDMKPVNSIVSSITKKSEGGT